MALERGETRMAMKLTDSSSRANLPGDAPAARPPNAESECLSAEDCLAVVLGEKEEVSVARTHLHLDSCESCRVMMAETVRSMLKPAAVAGGVPRTLAEGEHVAGRYSIIRYIAKGGMGEVYEALDTTLGERVALKTLPIADSDSGDAAERLLREVRIARRVTHPNVCRILELGIHSSSTPHSAPLPFLTMEFLTGETVAQRLRHSGPLPHQLVSRLGRELASGLAAVHAAGIVHRDFKSENAFLVLQADGTERAVVMDFGLARVIEGVSANHSSRAGRLIGTPAYMAPEQLLGQPVTPSTDVYAFGIVIFEMLTARLPFSGDSLSAVAYSRLHRLAPQVSSVIPDLPPGWDALLDSCLATHPGRRLRGMREVLGLWERIGSARQGTGAARKAVAVACTALLAITLAISTRSRRPPPPRKAGSPSAKSSVRNPTSSGLAKEAAPPTSLPTSRMDDARLGQVTGTWTSPLLSVESKRGTVNRPLPLARRSAMLAVQRDRQPPGTAARHSSAAPSDRAKERRSIPDVAVDPLAPLNPQRPKHPDDLVDPFEP